MRTILSLVALLLLLLFTMGEQAQATEHPEGWTNPSGAHPWGGDEVPVDPGDNNYTSGSRTAPGISMTVPLLDLILNRYLLQPTQPAIVEPTRPLNDRSSDRTPRFRSARKYDTKNRLR